MFPRIAITLGDPLGIGPEIVEKALNDPSLKDQFQWKIFGERKKGRLLPKEAGRLSWEALNQAVDCVKKGGADALVTAPVSKTHLKLAGFPYPGQTEYLAAQFRTKNPVMMLASSRLRVALVTIHVPLRKIFSQLTKKKIWTTIRVTHESLKKDFGISHPRLAVCGLNPHAGEGGLMGVEEKTIITPVIKNARKKGMHVTGPHPPDTVFYQALQGEFDAVVCHYHDQGLIPLKTLDFHEGVNVTLGLPIIRTSPDHGCAFDIAGKGIANASSMKAALKMALEIQMHHREKRSRN